MTAQEKKRICKELFSLLECVHNCDDAITICVATEDFIKSILKQFPAIKKELLNMDNENRITDSIIYFTK